MTRPRISRTPRWRSRSSRRDPPAPPRSEGGRRAQPASCRLGPHGRAPACGVRHRGRRGLPPPSTLAIRRIGRRPLRSAERARRLAAPPVQAGGPRHWGVRQVGIPLTVIGTGPDEERLRSLAPGIVTFVGTSTTTSSSMPTTSTAMVLVPGLEDFGYIPLEAASRGRPWWRPRSRTRRDRGSNGETGILVAGSDPTTWADAIRRVSQTSGNRCHAALRRALRPCHLTTVSSAACGADAGEVRRGARGRRRTGGGLLFDTRAGHATARAVQSCWRVWTKSWNFFEGSTPKSASIRSQRPIALRTRLRLPASRCSVASWT